MMQTNVNRPVRTTYAAMLMACLPLLAMAGNHQYHSNNELPPIHPSMTLPPGGKPPTGMQPPLPLDRLNLSESQQIKIKHVMRSQMKSAIEKQHLIHKTMQDLHEISVADDFDAVKAKSLADAYGRAVGEIAFQHAETQARIFSVLTEAQRKQLHALQSSCGFH